MNYDDYTMKINWELDCDIWFCKQKLTNSKKILKTESN